MNSRLQQFLSAENITQAEFADTIKVARASVSHILAGRNKPGWDFIANMTKSYPSLNVEWLITGKGKMYKVESRPTVPESQRTSENVLFQEDAQNQESYSPSDGYAGDFPVLPDGNSEPDWNTRPEDGLEPPDGAYFLGTGQTPEPEAATYSGGLMSPFQAYARMTNPGQPVGSGMNTPTSASSAMGSGAMQPPVRQRKAVKITIFYDDNTFEEFKK